MHPGGQHRHSGRRFPTGCVALVISVLFLIGTPPKAYPQSGTDGPARVVIYLPQGHPAYETLELFRASGLLEGRDLNRIPLARSVVAGALAEGVRAARAAGLTYLAAAGEWRLGEFEREGFGGLSGIPPRDRPFSLHWGDGEGAELAAEFSAELGYSGREDIPPERAAAAIGRGGLEAYGRLGTNVGYTARYRQSTETREGSIRRWAWDPVQGVTSPRTFGGGISYSESSGHVSADWRYLGLDLLLDSPAWGPSPARGLLLSGHAPNFGHIQVRVTLPGLLHYSMIVGSLASGVVDSTRSYQPGMTMSFRPLDRLKYIVAHRVDLLLFPRVTIGLTEAAVVGDRFPDFHYLVPTVSVWDVQHYLADPDNTMIGLDLAWSVPNGPRLYGAVGVDEWSISDTFSEDASHNWMAFQAGGSWTPLFAQGRLNLWVEATRVLPNVYRHHFEVNRWDNAGYWLGFWSAQNSEVLQGRLSWLLSGRGRLELWGRYARKGGEVTVDEQYTIPPSESFMFGPVRTAGWVGGRFTLEGRQHWMTVAEIVRAPATLWPQPDPGSAGQQWQVFLRLIYNPF